MKSVNLLPSDLRSSDRKASSGTPAASGAALGAYAVLGALALVVLAVAATVLVGNSIKDNQRELRAVEIDHHAAQREVDSLSSYGDFQALATKRLETVRQLAGSRFDWEQALRDLSRAVPSDVTLDTVTGTVTPGTAVGGSENPLRAAIKAPAIELAGCTKDQLAVARLMSRLRAVHGVTRVSLASSDKTDSEETGSTATAPTGDSAAEKPKGCGLGSPPKFQMVMFFETAPAAPGAPAGTAGAAPAAAATPAAGAATPAPGAATPAAGAAAPAPTPAAGTAAPAATPAAGQPAATPTPSPTKETAAP